MSEHITKAQAEEAVELIQNYLAQTTGESGDSAAAVEIPSADAIAELDAAGLVELAEKLSVDITGKKEKVQRKMLTTLAQVHAEDDEVDETDLDMLAEALGLTPDAKMSKTLAAVKEWISALSAGGEASTEETASEEETPAEVTAADETAAEEETPAEETAAEETAAEEPAEGSDGVDRAEIASKFKKFPDLKTMISQLTAYNAVATDEIEFNAKKDASVKDAYKKLVVELVDSSEEIAAWGVAYIRDSSGWSCGLPLEDAKVKGEKRSCGKCQITKVLFAYDDEKSEFVKIKAK